MFYFVFSINIIKWGLGIGDWGLGNPQSPIPNPQFMKLLTIEYYN